MDIKEYQLHGASGCLQRHPWELARLAIVKRLFTRLVSPPGRPATVADIGCGDAFVIRRLAADFPSLKFWGIDTALTDQQLAIFSREADFTRCTFFNHFDFTHTEESPDIVLLLDVLEHVEKDTDLLRQAGAMIKASGQVLITVPAFNGLFCDHDRWLGHHRRYSKSRLKEVVVAANLVPAETGYFFSSLLAPRTLSKLLEVSRIRRNRPCQGIGRWLTGPGVSCLITRWLIINGRMDMWLGRHRLPHTGLSLYAICTRSA